MRRRTRFPPLGAVVGLACLALLFLDAIPAQGAKWVTGCPRARQKLFKIGHGVYSPARFAHVGHDVTLRLREKIVARRGGFSTDPGGNTVAVTFTPLDGEPIPFPPFTVAAVSPDTLRFPVPDTRPLLGRLVVGPAHILVTRGGTVVAEMSKRPVLLPPMNDFHGLVSDGGEVEAYGALDATGRRVWVPFSFGGFGSGTPMPECPAEMTPIVALGIDLSLKRGDGLLVPHAEFSKLERATMFLGDFLLDGLNLYGTKLGTRLTLKRLGGRAVAVCGVNDTLELILMMRLKGSARSARSEILPLVRDGSPVPLTFRNVSAEPEIAPLLSTLTRDSVKLPCTVEP